MRLTFLGTGSAMPVPGRAQSGLLVEGDGAPDAGRDGPGRLLVDCGSGTLGRLADTEAGYEGVDAVLLTHHHTDHVADLLPLLKARWLADAGRLPVVGPPGTEALLDGLLGVHDYLAGRLGYAVREVDPGERFSVAGYRAVGRETVHSMRCLAYRLETERTLVVSGDTEADPGLAAWADGADALVHDCSFPDDVDVSNHPTPTALGEALSGHDAGTVYLTHLYPHAAGRERELRETVGERYEGPVRVARDGTTVEL